MILFLFLACGNTEKEEPTVNEATNEPTEEPTEEPAGEPSGEPSDEPSGEPTNEPTNEPAEEPAEEPVEPTPIILSEGDWTIGTTSVLSDICDIGSYNDVTSFTPSEIGVAESAENDFLMTPDNLFCVRDGLEFTCDPIDLREEAIPGAELVISNIIGGLIEDEDNMMLSFDITIERCEGWTCGLIELALPFPCPIELEAPTSR